MKMSKIALPTTLAAPPTFLHVVMQQIQDSIELSNQAQADALKAREPLLKLHYDDLADLNDQRAEALWGVVPTLRAQTVEDAAFEVMAATRLVDDILDFEIEPTEQVKMLQKQRQALYSAIHALTAVHGTPLLERLRVHLMPLRLDPHEESPVAVEAVLAECSDRAAGATVTIEDTSNV